MARQLRDFRQSHKAQLIRAQQTSQATIDSFPDPVLVVDPQQHVEMANPVARRLLGVRAAETDGMRRRWSGSRPSRCGNRWPTSCRTSASTCRRASTRPSCCKWARRPTSFLPRILPIRDSRRRDARRGRAAGRHHPLPPAGRGEEQPRGHGEPRAEDAADEHPAGAAPALGGERRAAAAQATRTAGRCPRQRRAAAGDDQQPARPGAAGTGAEPTPPAAGAAGGAAAVGGRILSAAGRGSRRRACRWTWPAICRRWPSTPTSSSTPCRTCWTTPWSTRRRADGSRLPPSRPTARSSSRSPIPAAGIPAEYLPLVFERYFRVPGDAAQGGSGLGLAIVREIVTAHGGTVECESRPGEKTVFRMSLPVWTARAAAIARRQRRSSDELTQSTHEEPNRCPPTNCSPSPSFSSTSSAASSAAG